ncbi:MAG: hypothetical protein EBZ77_05590 [Chitinophagia bacterium]|nr:hypothetical protein [Chitinophagia bacterium]
MKYREIVSVTGLSGLYQLLTTKSDGAIVRSVGDKATKFISARQHNVTPLDSIEVYTVADNVRLEFVFRQMLQHLPTTPVVDVKTASKAEITNYFKTVLPEIDEDRVYISDMKKIVKWFELLHANELLTLEEETTEETTEEDAAADSDAATAE